MSALRAAFGAIIIVAALALVACTPATGAAVSPTPSGLRAFAYDPASGSMVRADRGGIFRSQPEGIWQPLPLRQTMIPNGVTQVAASWGTRDLIVTAGDGAGVLKSLDGGRSWERINAGLPGQQVRALAVHTKNPDTYYASIDGGGLFRTEDGGKQWKRVDAGPPVSRMDALGHSTLPGSMNTGWIYAGGPEGLYLSMDCF